MQVLENHDVLDTRLKKLAKEVSFEYFGPVEFNTSPEESRRNVFYT
jgi:hypothetical protein